MKRTRKSDAGDKVGVIHSKQAPDWTLARLCEITRVLFCSLQSQKDVKASPQVNGKDAEPSKGNRHPSSTFKSVTKEHVYSFARFYFGFFKDYIHFCEIVTWGFSNPKVYY